eukprot:700829-Amphidinium_carterae.2
MPKRLTKAHTHPHALSRVCSRALRRVNFRQFLRLADRLGAVVWVKRKPKLCGYSLMATTQMWQHASMSLLGVLRLELTACASLTRELGLCQGTLPVPRCQALGNTHTTSQPYILGKRGPLRLWRRPLHHDLLVADGDD